MTKAGEKTMEELDGFAMWYWNDKILMQNGHYQTTMSATYRCTYIGD